MGEIIPFLIGLGKLWVKGVGWYAGKHNVDGRTSTLDLQCQAEVV